LQQRVDRSENSTEERLNPRVARIFDRKCLSEEVEERLELGVVLVLIEDRREAREDDREPDEVEEQGEKDDAEWS